MGNNNTQGANREASAKDLLVGFENKPLTLCYANSILQVLFHHPVFADIIQSAEYLLSPHSINTGLLVHLKELMASMYKRKEMDSVSTSKLMEFIERESAIFQRGRHQDSHQFYFWLMNKINEDIKGKSKQPTTLEKQFFSKRVTRTICQSCGSVSQIMEEEVDLSLFIPGPNVSLNHCIENYSVPDDMIGGDKFKCNKCEQLVDAKKFSLIKSLPKFLSIHLRRFAYDEKKKGLTKLTWLVPFPFTLRMKTNYKQVECVTYKLVGVVAHLGQGENYGHYMSYILIGNKWYCFNDEEIVEVEDYMLEALWGYKGVTKCAYMLFYSQI